MADFILILSGAGCGKTSFIIKEVEKIIEEEKNKKILIITYTNSCKQEIENRLKYSIEVTTFHSLGNRILNSNKNFSDHNHLDILCNNTGLIYSEEFNNYYNYILSHTPFDYEEYMLEIRKLFPFFEEKIDLSSIDLNLYFSKNGELRKKNINKEIDNLEWNKEKDRIKKYFNELNYQNNLLYLNYFLIIEKKREELNLFTYHHMILEIYKTKEEFLLRILNYYDYIFIDEIQDFSHIQFKIIEDLVKEMVFCNKKKIFVVGDVNQSIFSFLGANENNFYKFIENIKKIKLLNFSEISLNKTYRFGGEILQLVNEKFFTHKSDKKEGEIKLFPLYEKKSFMMNEILSILKKIPEKETILFLFQKRSFLSQEIEEFLHLNGFSASIERKIFKNSKILEDFFSLIKFILIKDEYFLLVWLTGGMINIKEPNLFDLCNKYKNEIWIGLQKEYLFLMEIQTLQLLMETKFLNDFLCIFNKSILKQNFLNYYGTEGELFLLSLEEIKLDVSLFHILYLENIDLWFCQNGIIKYSTIHNAKGTEADHVFILDSNLCPNKNNIFLYNNFPFYNFYFTNEIFFEDKEFKNLLYVSITRSKKYLYIFAYDTNKNSINKNSLYSLISDFKNKKE